MACKFGKQSFISDNKHEQFNDSLMKLRQANKDLGDGLSLSQILDVILSRIELYLLTISGVLQFCEV